MVYSRPSGNCWLTGPDIKSLRAGVFLVDSHACTTHPTTGQKPADYQPGTSSHGGGPSARLPWRWGAAKRPSAHGSGGPAWEARRLSAPGPHLGPRAGCLPSRAPVCPRSCPEGPQPRAFGDHSGPAAGSPRCGSWNVVSGIIRALSAACAKRFAGVRQSRRAVPAHGTKRPSRAGGRRPGRRSTGGARPGANAPLPRCIRLLSLAQ
jgi:hypothetical protein